MYILMDIEATCWITPPRPKNQFAETIEVAAFAIDNELNFCSEFQTFIKPTINPCLSLSCIELTNISQEEANNGLIFKEAMDSFYSWLPKEEFKIFSWGPFDRTQLLKEIKKKSYESGLIEIIFNRMKTIDNYFKKKYKLEKGGLLNTMNHFGLDPIGKPHRAYGDVQNMYQLFRYCSDDIKKDIFNI